MNTTIQTNVPSSPEPPTERSANCFSICVDRRAGRRPSAAGKVNKKCPPFPRRLALFFSSFTLWACTATFSIAQSHGDFIDFFEGIRLGEQPRVERALANGVDINQRDGGSGVQRDNKYRWNGLAHAADAQQPEMVRFLLEKGLEKKDFGMAIQRAIWHGNAEILQILLAENPPLCQKARRSIKITSMEDANTEVLSVLDEFGTDWGEPGSAIPYAIRNGNTAALQYFLQKGMDPNQSGRKWSNRIGGYIKSDPYLCDAALFGNSDQIKLLLDAGADPNAQSHDLRGRYRAGAAEKIFLTPLFNAVRNQCVESVKLLLAAGADPQLPENHPILLADLFGNRTIYDLLLAAGAKEPGLHEYNRLPFARYVFDQLEQAKEEDTLEPSPTDGSDLAALLNSLSHGRAGEPGSDLNGVSRKVGLVALSDEMENTTSLVEAALGQVEGFSLLDRTQLQQLAEEQRLGASGMANPATIAKRGALLGADLLVVLRKQDGFVQIRSVDCATGLVLWNTLLEEKSLNEEKLATIAAGIGENRSLENEDGEANWTMVSIPRIHTVDTTPQMRQLTKAMEVGIASQLAAQPGVFVVERSEVERLQLERNLEEASAELAGSALLVDGGLDQTPQDGIVLHLRVKRAGSEQEQRIRIPFGENSPLAVSRQAASQVLDLLEENAENRLAGEEEAEVFLQRAKEAAPTSALDYIDSCLQSAEALGLESDELLLQQLLISTRKVGRVWDGVDSIHAMIPPGDLDIRELSRWQFAQKDPSQFNPEELLEAGHRIMDYVERFLSKEKTTEPKLSIPDALFLEYLPTALETGHKVPKVLHSISHSRQHGEALAAYNHRLLSLFDQAIAQAAALGYFAVQHQLVVLLHIVCSTLEDEDAAIQKILAKAKSVHAKENLGFLPSFFAGLRFPDATTSFGQRYASAPDLRHSGFLKRLAQAMRKQEEPHTRLYGILNSKGPSHVLRDMDLQSAVENAIRFPTPSFSTMRSLGAYSPSSHLTYLGQRDRTGKPIEILPLWYSFHILAPTRAHWNVPTSSTGNGAETNQTEPRLVPEAMKYFLPCMELQLQAFEDHGLGCFQSLASGFGRTELGYPVEGEGQGIGWAVKIPSVESRDLLSQVNPTLLKEWQERCEKIWEDFLASDPKNKNKNGDRFRLAVLNPLRIINLRNEMAEAERAEAAVDEQVPNTRQWIMPSAIFPGTPYLHKNLSRNQVDLFLVDEENLWVGADPLGILRLNYQGEVIEVIPFPSSLPEWLGRRISGGGTGFARRDKSSVEGYFKDTTKEYFGFHVSYSQSTRSEKWEMVKSSSYQMFFYQREKKEWIQLPPLENRMSINGCPSRVFLISGDYVVYDHGPNWLGRTFECVHIPTGETKLIGRSGRIPALSPLDLPKGLNVTSLGEGYFHARSYEDIPQPETNIYHAPTDRWLTLEESGLPEALLQQKESRFWETTFISGDLQFQLTGRGHEKVIDDLLQVLVYPLGAENRKRGTKLRSFTLELPKPALPAKYPKPGELFSEYPDYSGEDPQSIPTDFAMGRFGMFVQGEDAFFVIPENELHEILQKAVASRREEINAALFAEE